MLDADGFVKSGWVHGLLLHQLAGDKFVIKGKGDVYSLFCCPHKAVFPSG